MEFPPWYPQQGRTEPVQSPQPFSCCLWLTLGGTRNPGMSPVIPGWFSTGLQKDPEEAPQTHLGRWLNAGEISEGRNLIQGYHKARITIRQALTFIQFLLSVSHQNHFGGTRLLWMLSAHGLVSKNSRADSKCCLVSMTVFPLHHLHFPSIFLEGKNTKRGKKPKPPLELSKPLKLCFSYFFAGEQQEQKCFRKSLLCREQ